MRLISVRNAGLVRTATKIPSLLARILFEDARESDHGREPDP